MSENKGMIVERSGVVVMVPPAIVELQKELAKPEHAKLLAKLQSNPEIVSFSDAIGSLAAELGLVMDGAYTIQDIENVAVLLTRKLRDEQVIVVNAMPPTTKQ